MRGMLVVVFLVGCAGDKAPPPGDTNTQTGPGPADNDNDGYGIPGDCNDSDPTIHPTAEDPPYDGVDSDCRGDLDYDADEDGFLWTGTEGGDDCDDENALVHPGVDEVCNGYDDDCDGTIDGLDADGSMAWYPDADGDGVGVLDEVIYTCEIPTGMVTTPGDCDDDDATAYPGAPLISCDGVDNDCNPGTLEAGGALIGGQFFVDVLSAVQGADAGEIVTLCEGSIALNGLVLQRAVTLQGLGSAVTLLDGGNAGSVFEVETTDEVVLSGLTVTGGIGKLLGTSDRRGGGLWMGPGTQVTGDDLRFEENRAGQGGAIWLGSGSTLTLSNSTLFSNHGDPLSAIVTKGGALASEDGGQLLFSGVTVESNDAEACGGLDLRGGTSLEGSGTTEIIENTTLGLAGGGLCAVNSTLHALTIARNASPNASGGIDGAGLTLDEVTLSDNVASLTGGGASLTGTIEIVNSTISGNIGLDAGAFELFGPDSIVHIADSVVTGNAASFVSSQGGGVLLFQSSLLSENTEWGSGVTDNLPFDVALLENNEGYGYVGVATFACNDGPGDGTCE